jgi:hypothetical protein
MAERDERGRFVKGGGGGAAGGRARAAKLSAEERSRIAAMGLQAIADRDFEGDVEAAQRWLASQGGQAVARKKRAAGGTGGAD